MPPKRKRDDEKELTAEDFIVKPKKVPKDPKAPKNPTSSYMFFATDARIKITKKRPGLGFTELGRAVGKDWHAMSEKQRVPYDEKAEADKTRYAKEMRRYTPSAEVVAEILKAKSVGLKLLKDPERPKRGRTAYLVFCDLHRDECLRKNKKLTFSTVSVKLAAMWKQVKPAERKSCEATAAKEKLGYEKKLAKYTPGLVYQEAMGIVAAQKARQVGKDPKTLAKKAAQKEKMVKHKEKIKLMRKDLKVSGVGKAHQTIEKLEEKLSFKQATLIKLEAEIAAYDAKRPAGSFIPKPRKPYVKRQPSEAAAAAVPTIEKEASRKKALVGKWVRVEFTGKHGKKGYRGHVVSFDEEEDSHTMRWLDVEGVGLTEDPNESSDDEVDALDPDEYELLAKGAVKKADAEEVKDKKRRKVAVAAAAKQAAAAAKKKPAPKKKKK